MSFQNNNPFKEIEPAQEVPVRLRNSVMRDINYLRFFADIADLFSLKYAATIQNIFITDTGKSEGMKKNS